MHRGPDVGKRWSYTGYRLVWIQRVRWVQEGASAGRCVWEGSLQMSDVTVKFGKATRCLRFPACLVEIMSIAKAKRVFGLAG